MMVPMSLVLAKINLFFPQHGLFTWGRELCINTVLLKLTLCVQFPHGGLLAMATSLHGAPSAIVIIQYEVEGNS